MGRRQSARLARPASSNGRRPRKGPACAGGPIRRGPAGWHRTPCGAPIIACCPGADPKPSPAGAPSPWFRPLGGHRAGIGSHPRSREESLQEALFRSSTKILSEHVLQGELKDAGIVGGNDPGRVGIADGNEGQELVDAGGSQMGGVGNVEGFKAKLQFVAFEGQGKVFGEKKVQILPSRSFDECLAGVSEFPFRPGNNGGIVEPARGVPL